jgi:hypothetical protein
MSRENHRGAARRREIALGGPRCARAYARHGPRFAVALEGVVQILLQQDDLGLQADDFAHQALAEQLELSHRLDLVGVPNGHLLRETANMAVQVSVYAAHEGPNGRRNSIPTDFE